MRSSYRVCRRRGQIGVLAAQVVVLLQGERRDGRLYRRRGELPLRRAGGGEQDEAEREETHAANLSWQSAETRPPHGASVVGGSALRGLAGRAPGARRF